MLDYDFETSVGYWICSTSHAIRKHLGAHLAPDGVTLRQFEVLATLAKNPECGSQTEIADALGIEPHTLAGVLKRMERDGLLERTACHQDRRKNRVQPTAKAEEMWERATLTSRGMRDDLIRGFSPEELAILRNLCKRLQSNIEAAGKPTPPAVQNGLQNGHSPAAPHAVIPFSPMIHP